MVHVKEGAADDSSIMSGGEPSPGRRRSLSFSPVNVEDGAGAASRGV